MTTGIRILTWQKLFEGYEYFRLKELGALNRVAHGEAARELANLILTDHAIQHTAEEPDPNNKGLPFGGMCARMTWRIGVADRTKLGDLNRQIEDARWQGMREAAEMVRQYAAQSRWTLSPQVEGVAKHIEAVVSVQEARRAAWSWPEA